MSKLKELRDRRAAVVRNGEQVISTYTTDEREPTEQEMNSLLELAGERETLDLQITELEARQDLERGFQTIGDAVRITGGTPRSEDDPRGGFNHYGEFCLAVMQAARPQGYRDPRLAIGAAPTTFGNESGGADGGFLVPTDFSNTIMAASLEEDALLPLTDGDPVSGNGMAFPADETTPWGASGIIAAWEGEGTQLTQRKPVTRLKTLRLKKLTCLVPMTDELMEDALTSGSYVERKSGEAIRWKTNDAIINGTGAGQPLGALKSGSLVTVAKQGSQTADTIVASNVAKMYSRVVGQVRGHWLVNPDAFEQLMVMTIGDKPIWIPPSDSLQNAPGGLLFGRPVMFSDTCATVGDLGDIIFGNFQGYKTITKGSGAIDTATSMHLWFDYDVTAFKATFRVDGQPWLDSPFTPPKSSATRSHFAVVAAR